MTKIERKYFDAKTDLIKAFDSISKLEPWQKEQLVKDLFGVEMVNTMYNMIRFLKEEDYFRWQQNICPKMSNMPQF